MSNATDTNVRVTWRCRKCNLETPAFADVGTEPDARKVNLTHECHHCDAELAVKTTVGEIRKRAASGKVFRPDK